MPVYIFYTGREILTQEERVNSSIQNYKLSKNGSLLQAALNVKVKGYTFTDLTHQSYFVISCSISYLQDQKGHNSL